jgi:hypothetical protein
MNRQPSRTDIFEAHKAEIQKYREEAYDLKTLARAYSDLADQIQAFPTKGELWDVAREEVMFDARRKSEQHVRMAAEKFLEADELEEKGIE